MKFSLIMATLGRFEEVAEFCNMLAKQIYKDFELIVVDQNEGDGLKEILAPFKKQFQLIHIQSNKKGLSVNRNIGLQKATGDIIAFPDDDCLYNEDTLEYVLRNMQKRNVEYFSINWHDSSQPEEFQCVLGDASWIEKRKFFDVGSSITMFVKKSLIEGFKFDEQLGVGAKFGSGEETDLLLYCLSKNAKCYCDSSYFIHHPYKKNEKVDVKRSYNYALGYGALMKKAFTVYGFSFVLFKFIIACLKNIAGLIFSSRRNHHFYAIKGKIIGFFSYKKEVL